MSRRTLTLVLAAPLISAALAGASPAPASAALTYAPCEEAPAFDCARVGVPLDRSGTAAGTIALNVARRPAALFQPHSAVLALAGGPGQAVMPLGEFVARAVAPALRGRDLLLFDQRGTGRSAPLSCPALAAPSTGAVGALLEHCAAQIGPARAAFTTAESVADIEAVRRATGYQRLVLYGTSYGTKVALQYAARYPQHTEALLLDSVVPADGPEPFGLASFQAIAPALAELCSARACAGITSNPTGDLARLAAHLARRPLRGVAYDGAGHRSRLTLSEGDLLQILEAGDLNPALRALLPAAVRSALRRDPDPIVRLHLLAEGLIPSVPHQPVESTPPIDETLFADTSCEETPFPWQRAASAQQRLGEAVGALHALPAADFYPFDPATAFAGGLMPDCAYWPDASSAPAAPTALPAVPTLILSGAQDLRTPTALAARVAAQISGAQVEVVPYTGHSVIGSDFTGCAQAALSAFFTSGAVQPCAVRANSFPPTPIAPTKLAYMHAPAGLPGNPGRTLTAVVDAILDLNRQVIGAILQSAQELPEGASFGGLRGGYAKLTTSAAILHHFSFVGGVALNGAFPVRNGQLQPATIRISGASASAGTVTFGLHRHITGTLGGRRFNISLSRIRLSQASGADEGPAAAALPRFVRLREPARALAR